MKATREQVGQLLVGAGLINPTDWIVDGNKYETLVHLAQQFTLDQMRKTKQPLGVIRREADKFSGYEPIIDWFFREAPVGTKLYRIPETLE